MPHFVPPLINEPSIYRPFMPNCLKMSSYVFGDFLQHHQVDSVILSAHWEESMFPELARTVAWIQQRGMKVIVIGPSMEYDTSPTSVFISAIRGNRQPNLDQHQIPEPQHIDRAMAVLVRSQMNARYISAFEDLCDQGSSAASGKLSQATPKCLMFAAPNVPLIWDTNHFTAQGAIAYATVMRNRGQLP